MRPDRATGLLRLLPAARQVQEGRAEQQKCQHDHATSIQHQAQLFFAQLCHHGQGQNPQHIAGGESANTSSHCTGDGHPSNKATATVWAVVANTRFCWRHALPGYLANPYLWATHTRCNARRSRLQLFAMPTVSASWDLMLLPQRVSNCTTTQANLLQSLMAACNNALHSDLLTLIE